MKRILIPFIIFSLLFAGCDTRLDVNVFSFMQDTDNISVSEAIASGDEDIMQAVYDRELAKLENIQIDEDLESYFVTSLGIADLQSARSKIIFVLLALIVIEVNQGDVGDVISQKVVDDYVYETSSRIREAVKNGWNPTLTQLFVAVLGLIVWFYYIADALGTNPRELIEAYNQDSLKELLVTLDWENLEEFDNPIQIEDEIKEEVQETEELVEIIVNDPELEMMPDLEIAVENTIEIYSLDVQ